MKLNASDFFKPENIQETANIIRRMAVGTCIAEYANIELQDKTKQDLKQRVTAAISANRRVQDYFINHPQATAEHKEVFKQSFLSGKMVLLGRLIEIVYELERHISELKK